MTSVLSGSEPTTSASKVRWGRPVCGCRTKERGNQSSAMSLPGVMLRAAAQVLPPSSDQGTNTTAKGAAGKGGGGAEGGVGGGRGGGGGPGPAGGEGGGDLGAAPAARRAHGRRPGDAGAVG